MNNKQDKMTTSEIMTLLVAAFLPMLSLMGTDIHLASLPFIMRSLHTSKEVMQQSISFYFLGMGISTLLWGPLSDKYGRCPALAWCLVLFIAALAPLIISNLSKEKTNQAIHKIESLYTFLLSGKTQDLSQLDKFMAKDYLLSSNGQT
ncbi:MFS transporter [Francisellaceae bacterium]|nr:MFS transporter [Francisellaceae bacterium]